jgi:hypothetical protein
MQKNIDFGAFPDDPSADPIRSAFQKTQENFTEIFQNQQTTGVFSINRTAGAGVTVNRPTGDVILSANIACVKVYSSSLSVTILGSPTVEPPSNATIIQSSQTLVIDLPANINSVNNITLTGNLSANNITSLGTVSATGNITGDYIFGNGAFLTGISGGNGNGVANTVSDNAQPNITSVGTLTSLSITGNANIGNSINVLTGNITMGSGAGGTIEGPNLISSNNLIILNQSNLGNVGNVQIFGGAANNVLTTDGAGNLSWTTGGSATSNITTIVPNIIWDSAKSLMLFKAPNENIFNLGNVSVSPQSIDWTDYNNYYATLETNTTFEFADIQEYDPLNPISMISSVTLYLKQDAVGNRTITWPIEVKWPGNTIPTSSVTANAIDIYTFLTYDGGNTIIGLQQVKGIV